MSAALLTKDRIRISSKRGSLDASRSIHRISDRHIFSRRVCTGPGVGPLRSITEDDPGPLPMHKMLGKARGNQGVSASGCKCGFDALI